ncbi:MAG: hypothetical protein RDU24_07860 [Humidesulfovibrio sp.]|uniref:hypothetical protein n=1 Tax=Humidesulfovibrio sp. TaxID=2910988 RepID=UPI0027ED7CFA|nr:hypothetical protein [Humidesulfovibrio sp.]MDQ7835283.1 hypothetical protein [Humidesulfovibrio sp.]
MRLKTSLACLFLALTLLGGCLPKSKAWTHPRQPDPRKEDMLFVDDTKFCDDKIGAQPQGDAREAAMADCLKRLGWVPKEKD